MTTADAKVELVRSVFADERDRLYRNGDTPLVAQALHRLAHDASPETITNLTAALEAPHSMTEAMPMVDGTVADRAAYLLEWDRKGGWATNADIREAIRTVANAVAMQSARPIDQQEASALADLPRLIELQRTAAPDCAQEVGWNRALNRAAAMVRDALSTPIAPVQDDDAELIEALSNVAKAMPYGPDQAWIEQAVERLNRLGNQSVGGEGR